MATTKKHKRILLKLSGEFLIGKREYGIFPTTVKRVAKEIKEALNKGYQLSVVIGGGNIFRGLTESEHGMERTSADYMGMMATVMNCIAMRDALQKEKVKCVIQCAFEIGYACEKINKFKAIDVLENKGVVLFAGGTGLPFFSTDMNCALRACELDCDLVLKATKVDGVFDKDPVKYKNAKLFKTITYNEILSKSLNVMDLSAIAMLEENHIPLKVFSIMKNGNLAKVLNNKGTFTTIMK